MLPMYEMNAFQSSHLPIISKPYNVIINIFTITARFELGKIYV